MTGTLLLVGLLAVGAYTVGYVAGRSEHVSRRRAEQAGRAGERLLQASLDRPGDPRLN